MVGPSAKRVAVGWLVDARTTSLRRACRVVGLSTATWRYRRRGRADNTELLARLQAHAAVRARYGYRRLHTLIAREGWSRTTSACIGSTARRASKSGGVGGNGSRGPSACRCRARVIAGERWSMDFMVDTLADGRGFRTLNIVDDYTRECVAIEVDRSLPGARVVRVLERLHATMGLPRRIVMDNGPEFAGRALDTWAYTNGVELRFIRPGKPIENAYVESFNGKFRDECLNEHWFVSVAEAKAVIEAWRVDYNTVRPHHSLGQQTPAAYAAAACAGPKPGCGACSAAALASPDQATKSDGLSLSV